MSAVNDILREIPIDQLAAQLGTDEQTAQEAVAQAVPLLISGMQNNAQDPDGEQSLASAIDEHATRSLFDGGVDLDQVDPNEGEKIVGHIFGGQDINSLAGQYGALGGGNSSLIQKLLPILAPIVLAYIAKNLQGKATRAGGSGSILGDLLGGVLGGGMGMGDAQQQTQQRMPQQQGGGVLGDLLGGLLGGGAGGMLGGMLGGQEAPQQQVPQQGYQPPTFPGQQQQSFPTQPADNGDVFMPMPDGNDSGTGTQQEEQQGGGGLLGDILGGMFGGNKR